MHHEKYEEVLTLVTHNIPTMLVGEAGSGKTTIAQHVAQGLGLEFFSLSMTRQTTLSILLGYRSVDGTYIPTELRRAVDNGGLYLLDEIDASDPNVLLALNTLENGYLTFPDGIVKTHPDFRLMATANPQNEHHHYTGRTKLDAATLDRFDIIDINRDHNLEATMVDFQTLQHIETLRKVLKDANSDITVSMRDSLRYQARKDLDLLGGFVLKILQQNEFLYEHYETAIANLPKFVSQQECKTFADLLTLIKHQ